MLLYIILQCWFFLFFVLTGVYILCTTMYMYFCHFVCTGQGIKRHGWWGGDANIFQLWRWKWWDWWRVGEWKAITKGNGWKRQGLINNMLIYILYLNYSWSYLSSFQTVWTEISNLHLLWMVVLTVKPCRCIKNPVVNHPWLVNISG